MPPEGKSRMEDLWLWSVLAVIGETLPHSEALTGVSFSVRKHTTRISVWLSFVEEDLVTTVGIRLKEVLQINPDRKPYSFESNATGSKLFEL
jgi:hypothetical protein